MPRLLARNNPAPLARPAGRSFHPGLPSTNTNPETFLKMTTPTTTEQLDVARKYYREQRIPSDALKVMDAATEELLDSGVVNRALQAGALAPDFILPDAGGRAVRLHQLLESGPVVLVFYRGGWCPYCNLHLRGFQRLLGDFRSAGAHLVAVSPQLPDQSLSTQEKNALEFPVLSDVGLHAAHAFGIAFELPRPLLELYDVFGHPLIDSNGAAGATDLPLPATFVIREDGRIVFAHVEADYTRRAEPLEVLETVRTLNTTIA